MCRCRAMLCKRGLCRHAVSACVCVCPSRSCILSKRINISSLFSPSGSYTILVFSYQTAWQCSHGKPPPLTGASNAGGVGRNRDSEPIKWFMVSLRAVNAATGQVQTVLSIRRRRTTVPQVVTLRW